MDMISYFLGRLAGDGVASPIEYTNVRYNDDDTITLIDSKGKEYTVECKYEDGKLISISYEGEVISLRYDGDKIYIDEMEVELDSAPVSGGLDEIEGLINESGVLDSTEGTATEKVEQLIDKVEELEVFTNITNADNLFYGAKTFPSKAIINLPNATTMQSAFNGWGVNDGAMVEEIEVVAPMVKNANNMVNANKRVKKVILKLSDEIGSITSIFYGASKLEEITLNFSTKNTKQWIGTFSECAVLMRIIGTLDFSSATNMGGIFQGCNYLEEVRFAPNSLSISISLAQSSKLTAESIQSIIDGLATIETAQTLTLSKAISLTDEQKATINEKGWTLAQ